MINFTLGKTPRLIGFSFLLLGALLLLQCSSDLQKKERALSDTLTVITEKDLIPEGTAYDPLTKSVFIGSTYKRKVLLIHENGQYEDFVREAQDGILCPLGMEVQAGAHKLWVINGWSQSALVARTKPNVPDWTCKISCYDIKTRTLFNEYPLIAGSGKPAFLNDLTVSNDGLIYATESLENIVYVLNPTTGKFQEFLRPVGHNFLNGITFSADNSTMFVASTEGILVVNMKTRQYKLLAGETYKHPTDGLAFYQNSLISHQSTIIRRLYLNEQRDSVIRSEVLDDTNLNSSTTGEIGSEWYYYIANSQIRSGITYSTVAQIKPIDSLQNIVVKRKKL